MTNSSCNKESYCFFRNLCLFLFFTFFRCYQVSSNSVFQLKLSFSCFCQKPLILSPTLSLGFLILPPQGPLRALDQVSSQFDTFLLWFPSILHTLVIICSRFTSPTNLWASGRLVHYAFGTYSASWYLNRDEPNQK